MSKFVCKLKIEIQSENIIGIGFFLKFMIDQDQEPFYFLLSNDYIIRKDIINKNNNIYVYYDNDYKVINIKLDTSKRYIKSFCEEGLGVVAVEILDEDNIPKDYFICNEIETDINRLINSKIYIPQYIQGKEFVRGKIVKINQNEFTYLTNFVLASSGSPIILVNSNNVIGIHKEGNKDETENYGDFIYPVINIIKEDIKKRRNNGKYINGKYIWEDEKYYIGEVKNNIPNGRGIKYHPKGNILYEGNFINGKFEGNGKYYYDDGKCFIGEFKNGLRNGKGIEYYKNGNIIYEVNILMIKEKEIGNIYMKMANII